MIEVCLDRGTLRYGSIILIQVKMYSLIQTCVYEWMDGCLQACMLEDKFTCMIFVSMHRAGRPLVFSFVGQLYCFWFNTSINGQHCRLYVYQSFIFLFMEEKLCLCLILSISFATNDIYSKTFYIKSC